MPTCIICHQPLVPGQKSIDCPNGHGTHQDPCLKHWFMTGKEPQCPFCREPYAEQVKTFYEACQREREQNEKRAQEQALAAQVKDDPGLREKAEIFRQAQNWIFERKYDAATNLLFEKQEKYPNDADISFLLGQSFFFQEKHGLAINHFMKAVKIDFKRPMAFYYLAKCFTALEMPDKATWAAERAIVNFGPENNEYRQFCKNLVDTKGGAEKVPPVPKPPKLFPQE